MAGMINVRANINRKVLDGIIAKLPAGAEMLADAAADSVLFRAQQGAPVRTGELRNSGRKLIMGIERAVAFLAAHAGYVEFGTRNMAAQPFLLPALEETRWSDIIDRFYRWIGIK